MRSSTHRLVAVAVGITALAIGVAGCGSDNSGASGGSRIPVVASTDVWGSVLAAVGGDRVQVTSIIHDPSADPHSYETTPADAVAMEKARLTLGNGGGYDDFFAKLADQAPNARDLVAVDIAATGDDNEHVWYSFTAVDKVADQVAAELGEIEPASAPAFAANARALEQKVDALSATAARIGATRPGTKVLVTEPVPHYLLQTAGLTDVTPEAFSSAVENETDVPAAALADVERLISARAVKAVVNNEQTVTPAATQVTGDATKAGVAVIGVTETLPAGVTDYVSWMTSEVDALAGAIDS